MQTWFYAEQGQKVGPIPETEFQALVAAGKITPQTLVWQSGMKDWAPYGSLAAGRETGVCCECKKNFPLSEMVDRKSVV